MKSKTIARGRHDQDIHTGILQQPLVRAAAAAAAAATSVHHGCINAVKANLLKHARQSFHQVIARVPAHGMSPHAPFLHVYMISLLYLLHRSLTKVVIRAKDPGYQAKRFRVLYNDQDARVGQLHTKFGVRAIVDQGTGKEK
jgi:hypothetical protein